MTDGLIVETFCPGAPKTKGSLTFRPNGSAREGVAGSKQWRAMMARSLRMALPHPACCLTPYYGPVAVAAVFYLPAASPIAVRSGDIDKLERNLLDAMTDARVYLDDVLVTRLLCEKVAMSRAEIGAGHQGVWMRATALDLELWHSIAGRTGVVHVDGR